MPDDPMEQMAARVAGRVRSECLRRCWAPDIAPCFRCSFIQGMARTVLQALTPSDWAEGAVARGGMVAVETYADGERMCADERDGRLEWRVYPSVQSPLYRKADGGGQ